MHLQRHKHGVFDQRPVRSCQRVPQLHLPQPKHDHLRALHRGLPLLNLHQLADLQDLRQRLLLLHGPKQHLRGGRLLHDRNRSHRPHLPGLHPKLQHLHGQHYFLHQLRQRDLPIQHLLADLRDDLSLAPPHQHSQPDLLGLPLHLRHLFRLSQQLHLLRLLAPPPG